MLCVLAAMLSSCLALSTVRVASAGVKTIQALTLSDAQVEAYASEYIRELDAQNTLLTGGNAYAQRMGRITAPIVQADGYDIRVYQNAEANAFAVADGSIRVYSGLMDIMSDEELLGIIGHEIGHIQHKDTRETFKNALLTSALRDGIASAGGLAATLSDSQLGDLGQALSNSQYSQKQEFEADDYGYAYLKSRGVNPWAMALALEKLQSMQESGRSGGAVSQLFSTHPELEQRIRRMSQRALQDGFNRPQ